MALRYEMVFERKGIPYNNTRLRIVEKFIFVCCQVVELNRQLKVVSGVSGINLKDDLKKETALVVINIITMKFYGDYFFGS